MPNGDAAHPQEYNLDWCNERHQRIQDEFNSVWEKLRRQDGLLWGLLLALIGNFGGVIATLIVLVVQNGG